MPTTLDPVSSTNSNASRPVPPANTGSAIRDFVSNASIRLLQIERRFDPFFRPLFDALFRDATARVATALINMRRPNEGFRIAEERPIPGEEGYVDSIISAFTKQMRLLWKPGGFERGG